MSKRYCLLCNVGTEGVNGKIPNFCGNCGKPYIDSKASITTKPVFTQDITRHEQNKQAGKLNRRYAEEEEYSEHPEDSTQVPQIDKLDFSINVSNLRPNRENGRDVFNAGSQSEAREVLSKQPIKAEKISKAKSKQIQQETRQRVQEEFKNQLTSKRGNNKQSTEIGG